MAIELERFTEAQRVAIEHDEGNLQLIACAGAGKTEVLACRVARLLQKGRGDGLTPANIVAFTFQEKAAGELKQRIIERCEQQLGVVHGMAEMYVGTIHGFCLELIQEEAPDYLKYQVLDEVQQRLLVNRNSAKSGLTTTEDLSGRRLRRYIDANRYVRALDILRESNIDPKALAGVSIVDGLDSYRDLLDQHAYFDYAAMMEKAVRLTEGDTAVRARIADRISHVIVDEYQDVNPIQERLIAALHELGAQLCVIGDDDQTIHQWRGSDVQNILTFGDRYPHVTRVTLEENFRSSAGIIETARDFIARNDERLPKAMEPTGAQPFDNGDICALKVDSPAAEAAYIVEMVQQLHGVAFREAESDRGLAYSDMAVLLRSVRRNAEPIIDALKKAGIPFVVTGMNNLFDTAEAQAARELFYFVAGSGRSREGRSREDVRAAWLAADLGIQDEQLERALDGIEAAIADFRGEDQKRWGLYSIQRVFLSFLEEAELREERVPDTRGEIVLYNLGKFSQLISDFESIHFHSKPEDKYATFADFLQYQAEEAYDEGWLEQHYAAPNAVQVMTVHQAKGMEWPVVFVPALLRNRFPAPGVGGPSEWHLIPKAAVSGQHRYETSLEDERRLFYVAVTRSQKFLFLTWAPIEGFNNRYKKVSQFWEEVLVSRHVKRRRQDYSERPRLEASPRRSVANVVLSFSELKYFFECPYQFKLRILYGFNAPIPEALGYGKSLHDSLAEVHGAAIRGELPEEGDIEDLLARHLHVPFAYPALREQLHESAGKVLAKYFRDNAELFDKLEYSEKKIELSLGDGVTVVGRIDLVRRLDTDETTIVDLKTSERSQDENVTEMQLHIYVVGHQALTGRTADFVEIYELDEGNRKPRSVDEDFVADVKSAVRQAADALRTGDLSPKPARTVCASCDYRRLCSAGEAELRRT